MALPLPETFGRYQVLRPLGEGGMGSVYLARDTQLGRLVALKVPRFGGGDEPAPEELNRFFREARAAAALLHANLCPIFDVGEIEGRPYLTMAYLEGRLLSDLVAEKKQFSERQATLIVRRLALAMQAAHERGVIHRDLKPSNVMISPQGEPVIMDFGLARLDQAAEARLTKAGTLLGTPAYMAPEQVMGDPGAIGQACDIYALGVILYELLTGRVPFEGSVLSVLGRILSEDPAPPSKHRPDLDPSFEAICRKAMARKVEERYVSMADLASALAVQLRAIRDTTKTAPVDEPGPRTAGDLAATLAPGPTISRQEPETRQSAPAVAAPGASWRSHASKSQRGSRIVSGRLRSVLVGGAGLLLVVAFGFFVLRSNESPAPVPAPLPTPLKSLPESSSIQPQSRPVPPPSEAVVKNERTPTPPKSLPESSSTQPQPRPAAPPSEAIVKNELKPQEKALQPIAKKGAGQRIAPAPPAVTKKGQQKNGAAPQLVKRESEPKPARPLEDGPELLTTRVGLIKLRRVPAGTFRMGSPDGEGFPSERPQHMVRISRPFYLGIFEVTQAQYHAVMAVNPSWFSITGGGKDKVSGQSTDQLPVHNVNWLDAVRFCNTLSQREHVKPFYEIDGTKVHIRDWSGTGYRLPTEAEWEYACRAGSNTRYSFGDAETDLPGHAWYARFVVGRTRAVGEKRPNAWGLYDMHGNVWEWCWDWHDENYYRQRLHLDPVGPPSGTHRVLRGGSFVDYPASVRSAIRGRDLPTNQDKYNGLRIARTCP
jgi:serine/threonine protein kinase/formylglycine-generating enzyme required for sulfatase activity